MLCYLRGTHLGPNMCDSEMQRCCHQGDQTWIRQCWGRLVSPASWFTNELLGVKHLLFAARMQHFSHRASFPCLSILGAWNLPCPLREMNFAAILIFSVAQRLLSTAQGEQHH